MVQGTFSDLSEREKTKAILQYVQYHTNKDQTSAKPETAIDTKAMQESLKKWAAERESNSAHSNCQNIALILASTSAFVLMTLL